MAIDEMKRKLVRFKGRRELQLLHLLLLFPLCGFFVKCDRAANRNIEVTALESLFPVLEIHEVKALRYQDWCKVIDYEKGCFASSLEPTCVHIVKSAPKQFDALAKADLEGFWKALKATRTGVHMIFDIRFDSSGAIVYGVFDCTDGFTRERYVFEPGYTLPEDIPSERWHHRVNSDWYFVVEDWN